VTRGPLAIGLTPWSLENGGLARHLADQAERAERLGFHSFWLPEHHFGGNGAIPAPLLLLAAVAARTSRLRLATTSYLLPLRHPLHAAEEVAVLDRLSGGRLILGVGRGFRRATFTAFDVPPAEKRDRFEAVLETMRQAWSGAPVAWEEGSDGREPVRVAPQPLQQPHPPIWVAAFGPKAVAQAGRLGLPYLASPIESLAQLESNFERHGEACRAAGLPPPGAVPVMRTVFVSRDASALRQARELLERQARALGRSSAPALRRAAGASLDDWALVGEPEQVQEGIERYRRALGITHLVVRTQVPGLERKQLEASLDWLAELAPERRPPA
jgi:alkanesulfonate monooxygenase SsuD/methylene tetrahydromethanopterin reductase-like flavin-dependent oxidoreductase (luciferase family)